MDLGTLSVEALVDKGLKSAHCHISGQPFAALCALRV